MCDADGATVIHCAVLNGTPGIVRLLVKAGVAVAAGDQRRVTQLLCAAFRGDVAIIDELVRAGVILEARCLGGDTPLLLAASVPPAARGLFGLAARQARTYQLATTGPHSTPDRVGHGIR